MPRKFIREYFTTTRYYRFDLAVGLILLFVIMAFGAVKLPKYVLPGMIGLGACGIFFLMGPIFGFSCYFVTTFFRQLPLYGTPVSMNQVFGVLFVFSWLNWFLRGKAKLPRGRGMVIFVFIFLYFVINCLLAEVFEKGFFMLRYLAIDFFIALAVASILKEKKHIRTIFWIILSFTFVSSLAGAFELFSGIDILTKSTAHWEGRTRINAAAPNSIVFAYQILFAFPLGYYLFSEEKRATPRSFAIGMAMFSIMIALATFNRQTIILVGFTWILSAALFWNRHSRTFLIGIVILMLLMSPFVLHKVIKRLSTIGDLYYDRSLSVRIDGLQIGWQMFRQNPLTGVGLGNYVITWWNYVPVGTTRVLQYDKGQPHYPDMGYNQLLAEGGIIGLTLALIFFFFLTTKTWKMRRRCVYFNYRQGVNLYTTMLIMLANFLLSTAIQDTFMYVRTWVMFGLILGSFQEHFHAVHRLKELSEQKNKSGKD